MDLIEQLRELAKRVEYANLLRTEEATKMALVVPFLSALGYDVFNPHEVIPEYAAGIGVKSREKVDYAIMIDGRPEILIECKRAAADLDDPDHRTQLFRYFSATAARLAILTTGVSYLFFSDIEDENRMDADPFLVLDLANLDDTAMMELVPFAREYFEPAHAIASAWNLKYALSMRQFLAREFVSPSPDLIRFLASRVYNGRLGRRVFERFDTIATDSLQKFVNERVEARIRSATERRLDEERSKADQLAAEAADAPSAEEVDAYRVVRAIVCGLVDAGRIYIRDQKSYCSVLLDDSNRKPICRLRFGSAHWQVGVFDENKVETRHPISSVDGLYGHADELRDTIRRYLEVPNRAAMNA